MIQFTKVEDYPVWHSFIDVNDVNLLNETTVGNPNGDCKSMLSITEPGTVRLAEYLKSPEFKNQVISSLCQYERVYNMYPAYISENFDKHTILSFEFYKQTRFKHKIHMDYRTAVAQGLIYFDESHDSNHATRMYPKFPIKTPVIESNTSRGHGILMLNTQYSWHEGGNLSDTDRYFLLYCLDLKVSDK